MIHCSGQNFSSTIRQGVLCNYGKTAASVPPPEDDTSVGHFGTDVRVVPLSLRCLWLSAERCMLLCADLEGLGAGRAGGRERRACPYQPHRPRPALSFSNEALHSCHKKLPTDLNNDSPRVAQHRFAQRKPAANAI